MHRGEKRRESVGEEGLSALEAARGAQTDEASQDDAEVDGGDVDLVALEDVGPAAQVEPSHAPGLADVSEAPLDGLRALAEKAFAGVVFESTAIQVKGSLSASGFSLADSSETTFRSVHSRNSATLLGHEPLSGLRPGDA